MPSIASVQGQGPFARWIDRLNAQNREHFVTVLVSAVIAGALFPSVGVALKDLAFFDIPGTSWQYDFPNLALGLMMFSASLQVDLGDFRQLRDRPRAGLVSLFVIYLFQPALTVTVGVLWVNTVGTERSIDVLLGLMLSALMPVAMTSCVWIRNSGGNLALLLALIALTTATAVVSVPLYLSALVGISGTKVSVPTGAIVEQLVVSVTLPMVVGMLLRRFASAQVQGWQGVASLLGNVALWLIVIANVGVALPHIRADGLQFLGVVLVTVGVNALAYGSGLLFSRVVRLSHEDALTLVFASGMRSNSTGLMLGLKAFPGMPMAAVPAALYMISQHLMAAVLSRTLEHRAGTLLGRVIASERRSLEEYLERELSAHVAHSRGLGLVVFQVAPTVPSPRTQQWHELLRRVRRSVRLSDFVCELGPRAFAVVLVDSHVGGCRLVRSRLQAIAQAVSPAEAMSCGIVHTQAAVVSAASFIASAAVPLAAVPDDRRLRARATGS